MYYVDRYYGKLVKEKDNFATPERYYEYRKGLNDIIVETYIVNYNPLKLIDFAYDVDEDRSLVSVQRNNLFEQNGISKNSILYAYAVPPEWYEKEIAKINE